MRREEKGDRRNEVFIGPVAHTIASWVARNDMSRHWVHRELPLKMPDCCEVTFQMSMAVPDFLHLHHVGSGAQTPAWWHTLSLTEPSGQCKLHEHTHTCKIFAVYLELANLMEGCVI